MSIANRAEAKLKWLPMGEPLPLHLFSDCGPGGAMSTALSPLVKRGEPANVARGIYARPKANEFFGTNLRAPEEVTEAMASATGERLAPHGAEMARRLGLSTQMPVRAAFYTTGRTRRLQVGNSYVQFQHAPERLVAEASTRAGSALLALHHLGREHVTVEVLQELNERVPVRELLRSKVIPAWLRALVTSLEPSLSA